jgi:hypothetical protein
MTNDPYPECTKLASHREEAQIIGDFLSHLPNGYQLGEWYKPEGYYEAALFPVAKPIEQILADYFNIDMDKVEAERRQMLAALAEA